MLPNDLWRLQQMQFASHGSGLYQLSSQIDKVILVPHG